MNNNATPEVKPTEAVPTVSEAPVKTSKKEKGEKKVKKTTGRKRFKKIRKIVIIVLIIIAVILLIAWKAGFLDGMTGKTEVENQLTTYSVSRRTITESLTSTGTIEPNDSYTITSLVNGEVIRDFFEEGDVVDEDQLLYEIDSGDLDSSVKKAENQLKNAQRSLNDAMEDIAKLDVATKYSGTVEKVYVEVGDEVSQGTKIADIIDKDTMCVDIPFMSTDAANIHIGDTAVLTFDSNETRNGVVTEISPTTSVSALGVVTRNITISISNTGSITTETKAFAQVGSAVCTASSLFYYNDEGSVTAEISGKVSSILYPEGSKVGVDQTIVKLTSTSLEGQIESLELNLDDAKSSVEDAVDAYDDYNITSPIAGTVISKSFKAGDTIGTNNGGTTLAVIYDMSAFKFSMSIDELDIDKLSLGQDVIITSDAREGKEYHGTITNISVQGTTNNGTTVYPVTVTIEDVEDESSRVVDEDGTIHKTYHTGKTSKTKTYSLQSYADGVYTYSDGIAVRTAASEDGTIKYYVGEKTMRTSADGSYLLNNDVYTFSDGMSTLSLEKADETKMLRPGMNIDAEIIVDKAENVIAVPAAAVGRGNIVKVIKSSSDASVSDDAADKEDSPSSPEGSNTQSGTPDGEMVPDASVPSDMMLEGSAPDEAGTAGGHGNGQNNEYGAAQADAEYEEVNVTIGISDDDYIEITDGLSEGDIVIVDSSNIAFDYSQMGMMGGYGGGYGGGEVVVYEGPGGGGPHGM